MVVCYRYGTHKRWRKHVATVTVSECEEGSAPAAEDEIRGWKSGENLPLSVAECTLNKYE